jgi:predicted nucleic acid-binding protein
VIILDTAALFDALDASSARHEEARGFLETLDEPLVLSPFVLAELDYFLRARVSGHAALAFLREVESGAFELVSLDEIDIGEARAICESHAALGISLTDASLVVLARRLACIRIFTYDGHFRSLRPGGATTYFELLPADA